MARYVKCKYCGKNIDKENDFLYGRDTRGRYYHDSCYEKKKAGYSFNQESKTEKPPNTKELIHYKVKSLCGDAYVKTRVENQIKENIKQGRTPEGILKSLEYWYDVQKHDPTEAYGGIGIVEYIYSEAQKYYERKEQLKKQAESISPETVQKIINNTHAASTPTQKKERITKPRHVTYFTLD